MVEWLTAQALAQAGLPALPTTKRRIIDRANAEGWRSRPRQGRGGGREYHVDSLPAAARVALLESAPDARSGAQAELDLSTPSTEVAAVRPSARSLGRGADPGSLTEKQRRTMEARLALLAEVARREPLLGLEGARHAVVDGSQADERLAGLARVANARSGALSVRTLRRWEALRADGAAALAPADGRQGAWGGDELPPDWLYAFMKRRQIPTKPSTAAVHEMLVAEGMVLPSLRTVQWHISRLGAIARNRGRMGPRELKTLRVYTVRSTADLLPADVYTADGHCLDAEVLHPQTGRPFRPEVVSVLDVKTRRAVGWSAGLAESGWLVAEALRRACTAAVPAIWYVDNGSGFTCEAHTDPVTGLLARIGIEIRNSIPYNSQARGVIERFNSACLIRQAKSLVSYVGADMDREARQIVYKRGRAELALAGRTRILPEWPAFLAWVQAQIDAYNARPHSHLPKIRDLETGRRRHMTPDEAWASAIAEGWMPETLDEAEIADLARPHVIRQVSRGQVSVGGSTYYSFDLERLDLHGQRVRVAYDLHDGSRVWIQDMDGRPLCEAVQDGNSRAYFPPSAIEAAREKRAAGRVKRLERKVEDARAETSGPGGPASEPASLTPEQQARADETFAKIESLAERRAAEARPPVPIVDPADPEKRPIFPDDMSWMRWLSENPDRALPSDVDRLRELLRSQTQRLRMDVHGIDPQPLDALIRPTRSATASCDAMQL